MKVEDLANPVITIITIVRNNPPGLIQTLQSISQQEYRNWESIIVVGTSEDLTLSFATKIASSDKRIKVLEQVGLGIYSAMNQGISYARGTHVCFMNAGDEFASHGILSKAAKEIANVNYGVIMAGHSVIHADRIQEFKSSRKIISDIEFAFNRRSGCHQSMFFRRQTLLDVGGFDTKYTLASDFDLMLKVLRKDGGLRVSEIYSRISPGGVADVGILIVHQEKHQIRIQHFNKAAVKILSFGWTVAAGLKVQLSRLLKLIR